MTLDQLQRAHVLIYAHGQAAHTGSLPAMKAVCYIIRNRVRAGWHDGSWIDAIEHADEVAGNAPGPRPRIDVYNRTFQMLMQWIDEMYYSSSSEEMETTVDKALYFQFMDRPLRPWFTDNILRQPKAHPRKVQIGSMVVYD